MWRIFECESDIRQVYIVTNFMCYASGLTVMNDEFFSATNISHEFTEISMMICDHIPNVKEFFACL
jgi:hypothetical protein